MDTLLPRASARTLFQMRFQHAPTVASIADSVALLNVTADVELREATWEFRKEMLQSRDTGRDNG